MTERCMCCFCGREIQPHGPDIGALLYTTNWEKPRDQQHDQGLFCHAVCLQERLHPTVKLYICSLLSKEPLDPDQVSKLPEWLR